MLADRWDDEPPAGHSAKPLPLLVCVTAYDDHAVAAFEPHAVDYVLKPVQPVQPARLDKTVAKLQQALRLRAVHAGARHPWSSFVRCWTRHRSPCPPSR